MLRRKAIFFFFFNDTATTEIYTLSLHDALPILARFTLAARTPGTFVSARSTRRTHEAQVMPSMARSASASPARSEEHTSELQSRQYLVCRLLLEKKKNP